LVVVRLEVIVQEHAVARLSRQALQRQGNEVAEAAARDGILAGKQAIVGRESDIGRPV
jgi:hypothetical protein